MGSGRQLSPDSPWNNKDYLHSRYVVRKMSITEIAKECASLGHPVDPATIYRALQRNKMISDSRTLGPRTSNKKGKGFYG